MIKKGIQKGYRLPIPFNPIYIRLLKIILKLNKVSTSKLTKIVNKNRVTLQNQLFKLHKENYLNKEKGGYGNKCYYTISKKGLKAIQVNIEYTILVDEIKQLKKKYDKT